MRLAILGAGGHGRVVADAAQCGGWTRIEFYDDAADGAGPWNVCGDTAALLDRLDDYDGVVVAIGRNGSRQGLQRQLGAAGARLATIVHPAAIVSSHASLGPGSVVFAGAIVNAGVAAGEGVILNTGCAIDHDCLLGDFTHVGPRAALGGGVQLGLRTWIGIGASVNHLVRIGRDSIVGGGAAVVSNLPSGVTAVGVPARALRRSPPSFQT